MKIIDVMLKVMDDQGHEIVLGKDDVFSFEVSAAASFNDFLTGGPWAADGKTRRHHLHWGNDWTFTIILAHHEVVPATETVSETY